MVSSKFIDKNKFFLAYIFLLVARLIAMVFIPLNDSTEARYAEIARIMLETGDWITPMQEYGVPFWAKPPLSTWLSCISMALFGVNEFAARLPALLLSMAVLWLVWIIAKLKAGTNYALVSCLVLASSFTFYLDAGVVMTDPVLLFATSLTLFGFWLAVNEKQQAWGYGVFVGLGIGMLAKGPVAWVLTGLPLFFWTIINNKWQETWKNLPWFKGITLTICIFLPWYIVAEQKTPGFLNYFIVGENINRFLKPGWAGDMYGGAHLAPHGYIWIYAAMGIFPWILPLLTRCRFPLKILNLCVCFLHLLAAKIFKHKRNLFNFDSKISSWNSFLLLCLFTPLIFFTFASNIIYPYVLPTLPFFALLFSDLINYYADKKPQVAIIHTIWLASSSGVIFLIITFLFIYTPNLVEKSQKRIINAYNLYKKEDSKLVYWLPKADFSARFYSRGEVIATNDLNQLKSYLNNKSNFIVLNERNFNTLPTDVLALFIRPLSQASAESRLQMREVFRLNSGKNKYILYSHYPKFGS
jgi:4-amino-4-deoxy-L-arabinose transferase-like glycosyltransferase